MRDIFHVLVALGAVLLLFILIRNIKLIREIVLEKKISPLDFSESLNSIDMHVASNEAQVAYWGEIAALEQSIQRYLELADTRVGPLPLAESVYVADIASEREIRRNKIVYAKTLRSRLSMGNYARVASTTHFPMLSAA